MKKYLLKKIRNTKLLKKNNYRKKISKHVKRNINKYTTKVFNFA